MKPAVKPRKKPEKSLMDLMKHEAKQFCLNTALHGYKFLFLPKRILLERIVWLILVVLATISGLSLLFVVWTDIQKDPTILVTDNTNYPIWYYPFPTFTICNFNKISRKRAYALAEQLSKHALNGMTIDEIAWDFRLFTQLIHQLASNIPLRNYTRLQDLLDLGNMTVDEALRKLAPTCDDLLRACTWKGVDKDCEQIFETVRTSDGYCCAFNYYALRNHTFTGKLPHKIPKVPRRVSTSVYSSSLEVLVDSDLDDYFSSPFNSIGQRIMVHNPYYYPDWTTQMFLSEYKTVIMVGVQPTRTYSTQNVRVLPVETRKCLYNDERTLYNFNYNFHNCIVECRMNISRKLCGCIPFYYHNPNGNFPSSKICNFRDLPCLRNNRAVITSTVPGIDFEKVDKYDRKNSYCNCLPDCQYLDYLAEASAAEFDPRFVKNQKEFYGDANIQNHSVLRMFFSNLYGTKNRRDVKFDWYTLMAFYGGLLGLFLGFSVVSCIEVFYFFILRMCHRISDNKPKTRPREAKFGKDVLKDNFINNNPKIAFVN